MKESKCVLLLIINVKIFKLLLDISSKIYKPFQNEYICSRNRLYDKLSIC